MIRRLASLLVVTLAPSLGHAVDAQFSQHPVKSVPDGDRIVVVYAGMPITVRLAHVVLPETGPVRTQAREAIEAIVKGKQARAAYCPEAGLDQAGLPYVYLSVGTKLVNESLVREGLARYDDRGTPSPFYKVKMASADSSARRAKSGIWASDMAAAPQRAEAAPAATPSDSGAVAFASTDEPGVVYSELNSSQFHLATCRWAKQMSAQRRIRYKSFESAEKAGKRPCWICLSEQAKQVVFGGGGKDQKVNVVPGKGPLVALDGALHASNCPKALERPGACRTIKTPKQAEAEGLKPCTLCLRLAGGDVPLPEKGECIGRAPPHRRPCRRAPADESGLCLHCQGKE
jgi:endonuclease YncB( thermonuclease family)